MSLHPRLSSIALWVTSLTVIACGPPTISAETSEEDEQEENSEGEPPSPIPDPPDEEDPEDDTAQDPEDDTTEDDTSLTFVPETEIGCCIGCQCDPFAQDCPEGEKCVPYASTGSYWDANRCVVVTGEQAAGDPCVSNGNIEASDDCDAGSTCWNTHETDEGLVGTCHAFCGGTADDPDCADGSSCMIAANGSISLCMQPCDPIAQDCGEGTACYWTNSDFHCLVTTDGIAAGEPCGFTNDCAGGLFCAAADYVPDCMGSSCCVPYCDMMIGDADCEILPGTSCVPFFEDEAALPGLAHVGVCVVTP